MLADGLKQIARDRDNVTQIHRDNLKRSSIAIVIRVPGYSRPTLDQYITDLHPTECGEILFIKRAVSQRDRWSGHTAIPGGRVEPCESDVHGAVRETLEEVGVDLEKDGFFVGALDQRLLKISWGRRIAMVICPFVFVLNNYKAPLSPQWTEVAASYWYPVKTMLEPRFRSTEKVRIGDRLDVSWLPQPLRRLLVTQLGNMLFNAIDLYPRSMVAAPGIPRPPFKLWGVTLNVLTDFFEVIEPGYFSKAAALPTFEAPDLRFWLWLLSRHHTKTKSLSITAGLQRGIESGNMDLLNRMLEGHFDFFPWTIAIGTGVRILAIIFCLKKLYMLLKQR